MAMIDQWKMGMSQKALMGKHEMESFFVCSCS